MIIYKKSMEKSILSMYLIKSKTKLTIHELKIPIVIYMGMYDRFHYKTFPSKTDGTKLKNGMKLGLKIYKVIAYGTLFSCKMLKLFKVFFLCHGNMYR